MLKYLFIVFLFLTIIAYFIPHYIYGILIDIKLIQQPYFFNTFIILVIGIFLTVFQTAMSMFLTLLKKLHVLAYINGIAFIVNILGNLFIKDYGIIAAAISTLVAYLVLNIGIIVYVKKYK